MDNMQAKHATHLKILDELMANLAENRDKL